MKVIIFFLFPIIVLSQSQFRINKTETFNIAIASSLKNYGVEIEYSGTIYTRAFITKKNIGGAIGLNFTSGLFEKTIYYSGIRLARKTEIEIPIIGFETGINHKINDQIILGIRYVRDLKTELNKTTVTPDFFLKIGLIF